MSTINDILELNLHEDIKNVIDLEDRSEAEIQQEIESYIITNGIGRHLYDFINQFSSNIRENGVWLSGFYGSGKSYFGKMLGYIIDNPLINGTPARDRFILRLRGINDESLIENAIRKLDAIKSRVIFLDVAKQNTSKGLSYTLFSNFLQNLGFRSDVYGYIEFDLFVENKYEEFQSIVNTKEGQPWSEIKKSNRLAPKVVRDAYLSMGYSEKAYDDTLNTYQSAVTNFSAQKFKDELIKYLKIKSNETLVFIFDEASEAVSQNKFTLLDLEGVSEALSSISTKVWTIAIAQEKLDDVINNSNITRSDLTKVTDRFKTKIHLESTEVDVIIQSRLLKKKDIFAKQLEDYYSKNEGLITDATNLKSVYPTKTINAKDFSIYYPFHKYQFQMLQKFLFSSNALVANQIAARGMIITTFDVLRKHLKDKELYAFTSADELCSEAQTQPPVSLVNKYDSAKQILSNASLKVDGEKLLKTIHLLSDSEIASTTIENITKTYIENIDQYYNLKPEIEKSLALLTEGKVLLLSNQNYKITSDLESKLLEEMKDFNVELFSKKRELIRTLKDYKLFTPIATLAEGSDNFKFSVISDQEDDLVGSGVKDLKLTVYSLFNMSQNRQDLIETTKLNTQYSKGLITLIPNNDSFSQIDKLLTEISRYKYMEEKYSNEHDKDKRIIISNFAMIREEKEKDLRHNIENSYYNSSAIYMFDELILNKDNFKDTLNKIEKKVIKNIFTKRLINQLSEGIAPKVLISRKESLYSLFSGEDFRFFDTHGNFIGEHLKITEEITQKINNRYTDGKSIETELLGAPWGYFIGTIMTTMAVLLRSGRLSIKHNGETWFSYEQKAIHEVFANVTKFRNASFKIVTASLSAAQKQETVQNLLNLEYEEHTKQKLSYTINDFDLANAVKVMADHFIGSLDGLASSQDQFETLFHNVAVQKNILLNYTSKVTEANYIEKVEYFLSNYEEYKNAIELIINAQKFIKRNLPKVVEMKNFIKDVQAELIKAEKPDSSISDIEKEFIRLYNEDIVNNFSKLESYAHEVKNRYFKLMKTAMSSMSYVYQSLENKVNQVILDLRKSYPAELNQASLTDLNKLKLYCSSRIVNEPNIEFSVTCTKSNFALSEIINNTTLSVNKETELMLIPTKFIKELQKPLPKDPKNPDAPTPAPLPKTIRKISLNIPNQRLKVKEYKTLLTQQLTSLAAANPEEEIDLEINF